MTELEAFVDREGLEAFLGHAVKERWLRYRVKEGMPHHLIAGKMRFRVSEVVPWLERHTDRNGTPFIQRRGEAA